ncbi:hypothetical protein [Deinococcus aerius]|uniref:hypothetical protein n=1 Tax=Deinococcus aerius TaxID=200253 RepID=UPI00350E447B
MRFSPAGGTVRVTLRSEGDEAVLSVLDTGPGVPPGREGPLLQRFIRVLLVEDHAFTRDGLRAAINLEPDLRVVAETRSGEGGAGAAESDRGGRGGARHRPARHGRHQGRGRDRRALAGGADRHAHRP